MKKKQLTLIILCACLVVISVVYFAIIQPMISNSGNDESTTPIDQKEGEGKYLGKLAIYPVFDKENLISVDVTNKDGTYTLENIYYGADNNTCELRLKGHKRIECDENLTAIVKAYICAPTVFDDDPIRDIPADQMKDFGLTDDTCTGKITVKYKDNEGKELTRVIVVGKQVLSTADSYYVTIEGRNVAYTMQGEMNEFVSANALDYVSPKILPEYFASTEAAIMGLKTMIVANNSGTIWGIFKDKSGGASGMTFKLSIPSVASGTLLADTSYIANTVVQSILCGFDGDEVVYLYGDDEEANNAESQKYGLLSDKACILNFTAKLESTVGDDAEYTFLIGESIDGYRYVRSEYYDKETMIVKIKDSKLSFLNTERKSLLKLAATNSVYAGFYKYLQANEETGESGVKTIRIRTKINGVAFDETFEIVSKKVGERNTITVKSTSGKYTFTDDLEKWGTPQVNQFRNFYQYLVVYPMAIRFNTCTDEEIANIQNEDNMLFELIVETNDGETFKNTYYNVDGSYALVSSENKDGVDTTYDTTTEQINILINALEILINGGELDPDKIF